MKQILLTIALVLGTMAMTAQVQRDDQGNFFSASAAKAVHDSTTTYTYTNAKGVVYPVYVGRKGGNYVWITSKNGNLYRKYLK